MLFDAFISHASEDKDAFVRPLAERLREAHVEVWYDEFSMNVGDSLRRSIDRGLAQSRFGIVVLSPEFFVKQWSQWELDGLVARQNAAENDVILPIWHNVNRDAVIAFSPPLADRVATLTSEGIDAVVAKLTKVIRPQGSSLVEARSYLIEKGWERPPVISDDWWLDTVALAESDQDDPWWFPLPEWADNSKARGLRIGQAALQLEWQAAAKHQRISQTTPPEAVHAFIQEHPALLETCLENLRYAVLYVPQLTIPGLGGPLEDAIEQAYSEVLERRPSVSVPEELALRQPDPSGLDAAGVACHYVQGGIFGPSIKIYETIDYAIWLISDASLWLPPTIRDLLTQGMIEWGVWPWHQGNWRFIGEFGFEPIESTGSTMERLQSARSAQTFKVTPAIRADMSHRFGFTAELLGLSESGDELVERFLAAGYIDGYYESRANRRPKK